MTAAPLYDIIEDHPDFDTVYTHCPGCGVVGTSSSADYLLTDSGELDPAHEIELTCMQAGHRYKVPTTAFLPRDAVRTCARSGCGTTFPCPAEADEVVCPGLPATPARPIPGCRSRAAKLRRPGPRRLHGRRASSAPPAG
jgi:hypothetical protein